MLTTIKNIVRSCSSRGVRGNALSLEVAQEARKRLLMSGRVFRASEVPDVALATELGGPCLLRVEYAPIRRDNAVLTPRQPWAASLRRKRHIVDFTRWKDQETYQQAFTCRRA